MNDHERARLHESGHAVLGRLAGQEASGVTVFSGHAGYTGHWLPTTRQVDGMTRAEWRAFLEGVGVSQLAGEAILEVVGDPDPRRGGEEDRGRALETARALDASAPQATAARLYCRALALAREHRAAVERFAATLEANHDRLAGSEARAALDAALGGWPTPRFDPASAAAVIIARRALFEEHVAALGPEATFGARLDLMRRCEAAVRSGRPLRGGPSRALHR